MTGVRLFLIRGLPGVGKDRFVETCFRHVDTIGPPISENEYFQTPTGEYVFEDYRYLAARDDCLQRAKRRLPWGGSVAVTNSFSRAWELEPYLALGVGQ